MHDVIVIGAGPAGVATAARLAQLGVRDVLVLERAQLPRDKPCGGGLTGRCDAALAALGLRLTVPHVAVRAARIRFGAYERTVALPRPVNVIRRIEFDASLVEQVRTRGVTVVAGERASDVAMEAGAATVRLASGARLRARVVVGADGAGSIVRKRLRGEVRAQPHRLFMQELPAAADRDVLLFDFTPLLAGVGGYVWTFPVAGARVNVGVMHAPMAARTSAELLRTLRAHAARDGIELPARGAHGWPVWGFEPGAAVSALHLLTVGDAAGIDALTGEGIAVALAHGALAGDAIAAALARGDFRFSGYRRALARAPVGRELARDRWLARRIYQTRPAWRRWLRALLFDRDFADVYAARIAGVEPSTDGRIALARALARDLADSIARRRRFAQASAGFEA